AKTHTDAWLAYELTFRSSLASASGWGISSHTLTASNTRPATSSLAYAHFGFSPVPASGNWLRPPRTRAKMITNTMAVPAITPNERFCHCGPETTRTCNANSVGVTAAASPSGSTAARSVHTVVEPSQVATHTAYTRLETCESASQEHPDSSARR